MIRKRFLLVLSLSWTLCAGCSNDATDPRESVSPTAPSQYSLKLYVERSGVRTRIDIGPDDNGGSSGGQTVQTNGATHTTDKSLVLPPGLLLLPGSGPGNLVAAAAAECGMVGDPNGALAQDPTISNDPRYSELLGQLALNRKTTAMTVLPTPWDAAVNGWYIFPSRPATCDNVLEYEETLLCVADKIAQLADAIAPVSWYNARWISGGGAAAQDTTWIVPPQSDEDKFIARDTAIAVLAHIPWLDSLPADNPQVSGWPDIHTCSALYAAYDRISDAQVKSAVGQKLFGGNLATTYPPVPTDASQFARARLAFETNTLRAAGQLLHDLVRESVYSDLAGSAHRQSAESDPKGGLVSAWGWDGVSPYNSRAHTARLLFGRLETAGEADPKCTGVAETDLLSLVDPGMRARANDPAPVSSHEAQAALLFERAGLVAPAGANIDLRGTLRQRLFDQGATDLGLSTPDYQKTPAAAALSSLVDQLRDSDLAKGAERTRTTFSMLTGVSTATLSALGPAATLVGRTTTPVGSGAVAVVGGLDRSAIPNDPMARVTAMQPASQCLNLSGSAPIAMMDEWAINSRYDVPFQSSAQPIIMQDVFSAAQTLRSRITKLRQSAIDAGIDADVVRGGPPDTRARGAAIAELGAWAGSGRIVFSPEFTSDGPLPTFVDVDAMGISLADFGATAPSDLSTRIALVYGPPTLAECAAGLLPSGCDAQALARAVWRPSAAVLKSNPTSDFRKQYGTTGTSITVKFDVATRPASFAELYSVLSTGPVYIITTQDGTARAGVGAVLGAMRMPAYGFPVPIGGRTTNLVATSIALSPMRKELVTAAFGIGKWVGAAPPKAGENAVAMSPQYCVEGVPRDVFVPLENELTSDSDGYENSWRHYLADARAAAARADDLGEKWVDIGFQFDSARENAGESIQPTTGEAVNVDDIRVDEDGNMNAGDSNGALGAILNQPKVDLLFFTKDPFANLPNNDQKIAKLKDILPCPADAAKPRHALCGTISTSTTLRQIDAGSIRTFKGAGSKDEITYAALGLADAGPSSSVDLQACGKLVDSAARLKTLPGLFDGRTGAFSSNDFSDGIGDADPQTQWNASFTQALSALSQMSMKVAADGSWTVTAGGEVVMASDPSGNPNPSTPTVWPSCLPNCQWQTTPANPKDPALPTAQAAFNSLFRYCTDSAQMRAPIGACAGDLLDPAMRADAAELNELRWRVQGTMWLAAMMFGGVPEAMFDVPLPAVDFAASDNQHVAPVNTVYGNGKWNHLNGLSLDGSFGPAIGSGEWDRITEAAPPAEITERFRAWGKRVNGVLPEWLRRVYAPASVPNMGTWGGSGYVHVFGRNLSGPADFGAHSNLQQFFNDKMRFSGLSSDHIDRDALRRIADKIDNKTCASPFGTDLPNGPLTAGWLQGLVASIKTQQATSSGLRQPFYSGDELFWGLWGTTYRWSTYNNAFEYHAANGPDSLKVGRSRWFDQVAARYHWNPNELNDVLFGDQRDTDFWMPIRRYQYGQPSTQDSYSIGWEAFELVERLPSHVSPSQRVGTAVNSGAPNGDCGAAWELTEAVALACVMSVARADAFAMPSAPPGNITSEDQLATLEAWLRGQRDIARQAFGQVFVEKVPAAVIGNLLTRSQTSGGVAGDYGKTVFELSASALDVPQQWNTIDNDLRSIVDDLAAARAAIDQIHAQNNIAQKNVLIQKIGTYRDIAKNLAEATTGIASFVDPTHFTGQDGGGIAGKISALSSAADGAAGLLADQQVLDALGEIERNNERSATDGIRIALANLDKAISSSITNVKNGILQIRADADKLRGGLVALDDDRAHVAYYAGKAAGVGVWNCGTANQPKECVSHVNTVLNRRYAGYQIRYERALRDAKALAYLARRAIEQRIGLRLDQITTPVGPLDAPSTWADDVCRLTGVDYKRLRQELSLDAGAAARNNVNAELAAEFADAFIGDYVEKLANFVDYYNVAYPSHDGDDTAILSLRENVLNRTPTCIQPSRNLLVESGRMYAAVRASAAQSARGWQRHSCTSGAATCLQVLSSGSVALPSEAPVGGAAWLSMQPRPAPLEGFDAVNDGAIDAPPGFVSQAVSLDAGPYALSWWDQARDSAGAPSISSQPYVVVVYDASWNPISSRVTNPADGTQGWSTRQTMNFQVPAPGVYHVGFAASLSSTAPGSVAIANAQLERAQPSAAASVYENTDGIGRTSAFACAATAEQLRNSFARKCDVDGTCYYELKVPIEIDTRAMTANGHTLVGKVARGNYNFRHIDVAANLVGSGVHDCTGTGSPDCYGAGFIEFDLDHDGTDVGVVGFDSEVREFDFGVASVSRGKALAAERYITVPIASADEALLQQPGILKPELRGRPLDGSYRLRVYDSPSLRWDRLEDVQIVLKYRYWSRITTPGQF